ncbi:glycine/sarcosine/betaine reductase component B subunit [Extibacter muris]|uniref:glycine/sarcosine/betaine reductase component B subunit n=1 Tax=Extibacter muris TaxID=1796622 RepID=UPI00210DB78B|nr:glycine/sarcosine/betaine reductase component B subunit [Extibacter muris]MCQ4665729.1 glycine/sarcosine/betaine reductase component B subunit [Extibacter muris]MCQ4695222.1 glycine/sarcosine/betaine reductase component B subunit [Extibacter muris]
MGLGTSMKETTLHYYRDPLVEILSEDQDVNLRGIVIVGSPDKSEDKYLSAERVGASLECMRVDGAVFSCNGLGNNHIDYAHSIEAAEKRGIPVVALSLCPAGDFVVQNKYMDGVLCYYKALEGGWQAGDETTVLAQNTVTETDARKALAMLKLKIRKKEKEG